MYSPLRGFLRGVVSSHVSVPSPRGQGSLCTSSGELLDSQEQTRWPPGLPLTSEEDTATKNLSFLFCVPFSSCLFPLPVRPHRVATLSSSSPTHPTLNPFLLSPLVPCSGVEPVWYSLTRGQRWQNGTVPVEPGTKQTAEGLAVFPLVSSCGWLIEVQWAHLGSICSGIRGPANWLVLCPVGDNS